MKSASTEGRYRWLRKRARVPGFVLALAVGLVLPGQAAGAVTIGSNLESDPVGGFFGPSFTVAQRTLAAGHQAAGGLTSPINGVLVRWRVKTNGCPCDVLRLRVIRPGGDAFAATGAGTVDSPGAPPANETTSFEVNPGLPIRVNDGIGLDNSVNVMSFSPGIGRVNTWTPSLADGDAPRQPTNISNGELLLQAVIEPDKDKDGLGDESQDPDGGQPRPRAKPACLVDAPILGGNIRVLDNPCLARL